MLAEAFLDIKCLCDYTVYVKHFKIEIIFIDSIKLFMSKICASNLAFDRCFLIVIVVVKDFPIVLSVMCIY